jgi:hypothetical protein
VNRIQLVLLGFTACRQLGSTCGDPDRCAFVYGVELKPLGLAGLVEARLAFLVAFTGLFIVLTVGVLYSWR